MRIRPALGVWLCLLFLGFAQAGRRSAWAEGSSDFGTNYGLLRTTILLVYIESIGTETIHWNGSGSAFVSKDGAPAAEQELVAGGSVSVFNGAGRYKVRLTEDQPIGTPWSLEVRSGGARQPGRISSRNWQLIGEGFAEPDSLNRVFYVLAGSGLSTDTSVIEVHVDGHAGSTFSVVANEFGVSGTRSGNSVPIAGNTLLDGYPIFLEPPFEASYTVTAPTYDAQPSVSGGQTDCNKIGPGANSAAVRFRTGSQTSARLICDIDQDMEFNILGQGDLSLGFVTTTGTLIDHTQLEWDGFINGAPTPTGVYQCVVDLNIAEVHYIAGDVETAFEGIRMFQRLSDSSLTALDMYWDDSLIQNRAVPAMPSGFASPVTSGIAGVSSGDPLDPAVAYNPADGTGNARAWGDFGGEGKGDATYLDTFTNLGTVRSDPFEIEIIDGTVDTDGDLLRDVDEFCFLGTDPDLSDTDGDGGDDFLETDGGFRIDTDEDDTIDALDSDSDGDSLTDLIEGHADDTDGDGVPNFRDDDDDDDGVPTEREVLPQFMTNHLHPDTDMDGIGDFIETIGGFGENDIDGDGIPAARDLDSDADGFGDADPKEGVNDTDGDSLANYLDDDDDGDFVRTIDEATITDSDPYNADTDGDNISDGAEVVVMLGMPPMFIDTDNDGDVDARDLDSDDDGVPDGSSEQFTDTVSNADPQIDSIPNFRDTDDDGDTIATSTELNDTIALLLSPDIDFDGRLNWYDVEADGDGMLDKDEGTGDTDSDGIPDYLDFDGALLDDDGDGLSNDAEAFVGTNPNDQDSDSDSINDFIETDNGLRIDTDMDGLIDALDSDSDSDGVPDADPRERNLDTDGDGTPNFRDDDDDDDTVSTACEEQFGQANPYNSDTDGDGLFDADELEPDCSPQYTDEDADADVNDTDSDNDSVPDADEGFADTDSDGIPDFRDTDDDGDGIATLDEAMLGMLYGLDIDLDMIPPWRDEDSDGDLNLDVDEGTGDIDGDEIPNFLDADDGGGPAGDLDGDGVSNGDEMAIGTDLNNPDSDGDGIGDFIETDGGMAINTDMEDEIDALDDDSDDDGVPDMIEGMMDSDMDGTPDYRDPDDDGDLLPTISEGITDFDSDMTPNYLDPDDDDDGVSTRDEVSVTGTNPYNTDTDGDQINDYIETNGGMAVNTDGTGLIDALDSDSDDDFIPDQIEGGSADTDNDGILNFRDADDDGDTLPTQSEGLGDPDADMIPNYLDADDDGDGVDTRLELAVSGSNPLNMDSDGDMIDDFIETDGGLFVDTDGDGTIDALDSDSDGDGIFDILEGADLDTDGDANADFRDDDDDDDGVPTALETAIGTDRLNPDTDGDGIDDFIETNGGLAVNTDAFFPNSDAVIDALDLDSDGDTRTDEEEGAGDIDGDGIPNFRDLDSDGDGILDIDDMNQSAGGGTEFLAGRTFSCTIAPAAGQGGMQLAWLYLSAFAGLFLRTWRRR